MTGDITSSLCFEIGSTHWPPMNSRSGAAGTGLTFDIIFIALLPRTVALVLMF